MNIGLIIAGGVGARMNMTTPKQFVAVKGKPILVYTLEAFQKNESIDAIAVVCLRGWEDMVWKYARKYHITKLKWMTLGGSTGMESLRNGMELLRKNCSMDDIIVIHDAVRPLVSDDIINANIAGVIQKGNAITCVPCTEALLKSDDAESSEEEVNRDTIQRTQTPQSLYLSKFIWAHEEAKKRGIENTVATCTLLIALGEKVYLVPGEGTNFKITTKEDIKLMEAYLTCTER
ncbi:2-C-methyl-D-erythritol 4-phosphate cytidylyltransferase [Blautia sp. An249]|uniref:IspD/TarI family cytidylyltransferase n=1 Tax=Blautia sp. An249 TaxID=1965603 RepID=UPI000B3779C2|nr:IspD/TarI family cytidylyltransferase [Blautia sp. An249]OUO76666.1 2-C-methyl-D-erythritol 4-phosphate cytidylyltransferase [Blautia sp. An249]